MGSKSPIQVAREILERDLASTTEQEEILESVEEVEEDIMEIVEDDLLKEMAHGDKEEVEAIHDDEDEDEMTKDTDEMAHGDKKKMKKKRTKHTVWSSLACIEARR